MHPDFFERSIASQFPHAGPAQRWALKHISARAIRPEDMPFLQKLYVSTRVDEMSAAGWPADFLDEFLAHQFQLQHAYYQAHYGDASFLLLLRAGVPVGRLYWWARQRQAKLIDLSLLPSERGLGVGSELLALMTSHAEALGLSISLHVETTNPACRLYGRFGFSAGASNGVYTQMHWPAQAQQPHERATT